MSKIITIKTIKLKNEIITTLIQLGFKKIHSHEYELNNESYRFYGKIVLYKKNGDTKVIKYTVLQELLKPKIRTAKLNKLEKNINGTETINNKNRFKILLKKYLKWISIT